ncbi:uncharacterized protein [Dysidea avara]|uniref:uncharacterized protein n=1 Tax=Dysidea avara TaxID=196820 RepID=UPI003329146F
MIQKATNFDPDAPLQNSTRGIIIYITDSLNSKEKVLESRPPYLLIAGDFNLSGINWSDDNFSGNSYEQEFYDTVQECVLFQHVNESTCFRPGSSPHVLDLVLTNEENIVKSIKYSSGLGLSDHLCLNISLSCSPITINQSSDVPSYNFNKGDYMKLKSLLNETAWLTELQDLNHKKETLWKRFRRTGNHLDHLRFTQVRNSLRRLTHDLRSKFEMRIAKEVKTNPKAFWRYVNSKVKVKPSIPTLVDESLNDTEAATDESKAEMLNKFFTSTFTRESMDNIPEFQDRDFVTNLDGISIDAGIAKEKLCDLNSSKATGPDELPPRVLKEAAAEISIPPSIIFKKSLSEGRLPPEWKVATIIPTFKKGNKSSPCNYRYETLDSGNSVDVLYLDFKKAFDSVPHDRLLKKIYAYGFRGDLFNWIQDFLKGRRQRVSVNGSMSDDTKIYSSISRANQLSTLQDDINACIELMVSNVAVAFQHF